MCVQLVSGFHNGIRIVGEMFPPNWGVLADSTRAAIVTFDTALLGTTVAFVISLVLAPLAARNITPHRALYEVARAAMGIARTIPLWVSGLLFLVTVGISPFAGVLALSLETVGVLRSSTPRRSRRWTWARSMRCESPARDEPRCSSTACCRA